MKNLAFQKTDGKANKQIYTVLRGLFINKVHK